ncbi:hypothetical protein GCM10027586_00550 [Kineococcus gypseus]|uniref:AraC-like ligand-binding domain-containing protein n=1 Tax=Kineococcus gypseus TaxID=1637102 RepID=UPI003D7EC638
MLLFDSAHVEPERLFPTIADVLERITHPLRYDPGAGASPSDFSYTVWSCGSGGTLLSTRGPGVHVSRTQTHRFLRDEGLVTLTLRAPGGARLEQGGELHDLRPGGLLLCDMSRPYDYVSFGTGQTVSYQMTLDSLGLDPVDIATAASRLDDSPLLSMVREHLVELAEYFRAGHPPYRALHQATVDLARSLLLSVLPLELPGSAPGEDADSLWRAVRIYVRRHLREPDLSSATVARALGVGLDQLHRLGEERGSTIEHLVLSGRLHGARTDLAEPSEGLAPRALLVSTATRWGFGSPDGLLDALAAHPQAAAS